MTYRVELTLICDGCKCTAITRDANPEDADISAERYGWTRVKSKKNRILIGTLHLCPSCSKAPPDWWLRHGLHLENVP